MTSSETHDRRLDRDATGSGEKVYSFGDYRLIPARQLLLRGSYPVRVGTRALDLLRLLVEKQGELVSKEQLIGHAWPDTFVHESNLKVNIAALRRTLLQGRSELPFIATIPGRGYRFVTPVRVETETLPAFAPPHAGLPHDHLPPSRALIGRDEDIAELSAELVATGFLTIVGAPGVGKTTAAVAVARQVSEHYEDGVRFIDFSTIGDARLVCPVIASSIGASGALSDLLCGILEALRGQRTLLVFDNCEHLLTSISLVADQIRSTLPDIGVLATSREPLRSQFEAVHILAPLACPSETQIISPDEALGFSAVALFLARANEVTGYVLAEADAPHVAAICRRLDGIPLAIELAAPRLASDSPATLWSKLEQGFEVLNYGPRNAPARHQALTATLDWSYRLLSDREAKVLRLLSVFGGAFTLDDVIGLGESVDASADDLVRCVSNLATKSLLSSRLTGGRLVYRMLGATRAYAGERLRQAGEDARVQAGHAAVLLSVLEQAEQEWRWRSVQEWTACYAPRLEDLLKAIDWALSRDGDLALGLRLTCLAIPLWSQLSLSRENLSRLRLALDLTKGCPGHEALLRTKLQTAYAGGITLCGSLGPDVEAAWRDAVRMARRAQSRDYELRALGGLASLLSLTGRHRQALSTLEAFAIIIEQQDDLGIASEGERLGAMAAFYCGDIQTAHGRLRALARHGAVPDRQQAGGLQIERDAAIQSALATAAFVSGDTHAARQATAAALTGARSLEHSISHANALVLSALPIALWTGDLDAADSHLAVLVDNLAWRNIGVWEPVSRFFAGAISSARGEADGLHIMQTALEALLARNVLLGIPYYASLLAEAALDHDRPETTRASVALARTHAEQNDEKWCLAEIVRIEALIARREGDFEASERALLNAMSLAQHMGAGAFELKAAAHLAEHWIELGRITDAVGLQQSVCERFDLDAGGLGLVKVRSLIDLRQKTQAA